MVVLFFLNIFIKMKFSYRHHKFKHTKTYNYLLHKIKKLTNYIRKISHPLKEHTTL